MKRNLQESKTLNLGDVKGGLGKFSVGDKLTGLVDPKGNQGEIEILGVYFQPSLKEGLITYIEYKYTNLDTGKTSVDTKNSDNFGKIYLQDRD